MIDRNRIFSLSRSIIFFLSVFFYIRLRIDPALIYQWQNPVFYTTCRFFKTYLIYPGGLTDYISAFLSQFYYYPLIGAVIITVIIWLICLTTWTIIRSISNLNNIKIFGFLPAIFLLILHSQYEHSLAVSVGLLISLFFFNIYIRSAHRRDLHRFAIFLTLSLVLYYVTAGPLLLFVLLCVIFEFLSKRTIWLAVSFILLALIIPYGAAAKLFLISLKNAYFYLLTFYNGYKPSITPYMLYLFFPVILTAISLKNHSKTETSTQQVNERQEGVIKSIGYTLALFILLFIAAFFSYDAKSNLFLKVDYYARHRMWQQLLNEVENKPIPNLLTAFHINQALYHTGRLPYEMFHYPQQWGESALLLSTEDSFLYPLQTSDIFMDLGHVNAAEHWANEALTVYGERPWTLRRLAEINLLKRVNSHAQLCINLLKKTLIGKRWAERFQHYLDDSSLISEDEQLAHVQSVMVKSDFMIHTDYPFDDIALILEDNKFNKMAFQYLMAYYLIDGKVGKFIKNVSRLSDFGYLDIPLHYEEAILLYIQETGRRDFELGNYQFRKSTIDKLNMFHEIYSQHNGDKGAAEADLKSKFGDTYWYYVLYDLRKDNQ